MVRHPHFTHPIFVRFPRPASLGGRDGVVRFPPAAEVPFIQAVARRLRSLDPSLSTAKVLALVDGRQEEDVRRALHATERARPGEPLSYFRSCLGKAVATETRQMRPVLGVKTSDDPYAP
jgi:hypothetical protein